MATVTLRGNTVRTSGELPAVGTVAPAFSLVDRDLKDVGLGQFAGQTKVLNVFPSIDTATCATSVRKFNEKAGMLPNLKVLCISADLPFAMKRFCIAEKLDHVEILSLMRGREFAEAYGLRLLDGPLAGLTARACLVLGPDNRVLHAELVSEIAHEPDYDAALAAAARVAN